VVLHIGAMKTGTTFIQSVLARHPVQLAAAGVEFRADFRRQLHAVRRGLRGEPAADLRLWRQLMAEARKDRTSIVSMAFLSFARPEEVAAFLKPLRECDVHRRTVVDTLAPLRAEETNHC
jgi:hypothetical protein